jgi:predicted amidohydrolase
MGCLMNFEISFQVNKSLVVRIHGIDVGIAICEDIWREQGPVAELAARHVGLVLVPNGSPLSEIRMMFEPRWCDARSRDRCTDCSMSI